MPEPTDTDQRQNWSLITDLLDVLERHGYHSGDDLHVGRVIGYLPSLARIYSGEQEQLTDGPGVAMPGGGWISGACFPAMP